MKYMLVFWLFNAGGMGQWDIQSTKLVEWCDVTMHIAPKEKDWIKYRHDVVSCVTFDVPLPAEQSR